MIHPAARNLIHSKAFRGRGLSPERSESGEENTGMGEKIAVLGAGNGGHALAFSLASMGHRVLVYEHPDFIENLQGIGRARGIRAVERITRNGREIAAATSGFAPLEALTSDMKEAAGFADILFVIVPSFAQEPLFSLLLPNLGDRHTIVLLPGNFGSLVLMRMMREAGCTDRPTLVEANSIPHACRITGPGEVFVLGVKKGFEVASLPAAGLDDVRGMISELLGLECIPLRNVLAAGLANANMIVHPATAVLNMGVAESRKGEFYFYREGMSESVTKVQQAIDDERLAVARALGLHLAPFVETVRIFYNLEVENIYDFARNSPIHSSFGYDGPRSPRDRYVSEDCPYLLVPLLELGSTSGVETPAVQCIVRIASIYNDTDYLAGGRTLERLGLAGLSREEILDYVERPYAPGSRKAAANPVSEGHGKR